MNTKIQSNNLSNNSNHKKLICKNKCVHMVYIVSGMYPVVMREALLKNNNNYNLLLEKIKHNVLCTINSNESDCTKFCRT